MGGPYRRALVVVAVSALTAVGGACTEDERGSYPIATPSGPRSQSSEPPEVVTPIPEGQSLMDPGRYLAQTNPAITLTTTTPWYGAANIPGFVNMGQLDHFPYSELFFLNIEEVVDPGNPPRLRPAPEDLLGWLVDDAGMEVVGGVVPVDIDGFAGRQADIRVSEGTECAPKETRPFPQACVLFFSIPGDPSVFAFARGMAYRITVIPDLGGQTVTLLFTDFPNRIEERGEAADEVVRSIDFDI